MNVREGRRVEIKRVADIKEEGEGFLLWEFFFFIFIFILF